MRKFISPMLACPVPDIFNPTGEWTVEEKIDGHRLIVTVDNYVPKLEEERAGLVITGYSRNGLVRDLPEHLLVELSRLPLGTYDGELFVPGSRSYGVTELVNGPNLRYKIFDILELLGNDTTAMPFKNRRAFLEEIFSHSWMTMETPHVVLSNLQPIKTLKDAVAFAAIIMKKGGEGAIIKNMAATYAPGKRPKLTWLKIKDLQSDVLTVTGFIPGKMGKHATVVLRNEKGIETTVKTKNNAWLAIFDAGSSRFIGKKLMIEFQERTPDGSYRHPRWDRWENDKLNAEAK